MNTSEMRQNINQYLDQLSPDRLSLAAEFLAYLAEKEQKEKTTFQTRADLIRAAKGKYAHLPNSSEEFARRKQEEIDLEERVS